jgi:hypothetical protein
MPTPKGGGSSGVKILIGVVVLAVLGAGAFFVLGGDDDKAGGGGSPVAAVNGFFQAAIAGDCEKAIGFVTDATWSEGGTKTREEALQECASDGVDAEFNDASVEDVKLVSEQGTTATVSASLTSGGETVPVTFPMVKEDGSWKIDFPNVGLDEGDGSDDSSDDGSTDSTDFTIPEDFDPGDIDTSDMTTPDGELIPECDFSSSEYDPMKCAEAIGG